MVTVTGPRQSGKTTLVRTLLPERPYVSLESPAQREFARQRPAEFLQQFPAGAVIDEAQHAPELFSELQGVADAAARMGLFVLTGSQNLSLLSRVTQSLAGRTALVELLPLSVGELRAAGLREPLHSWRDNIGTEVDAVLERGNVSAIHPALVYGGESRFTREGVDVMPWSGL